MKISDVYSALELTPDRRVGSEKLINKVTIDSRQVTRGDLFIAIQGENFNGNAFVKAAYEAGAIAAVVSERDQEINPEEFSQITVSDTTAAFGLISQYWREQFSIPVIAITGSQGKTTVREMVASILKLALGEESVLVSEKNYNNHWGLPMTLVKLNQKHKIAVLELGMNHSGEIAYLTKLCNPTVGVITLAAETHTAGVKNGIQGIAKAKGELFENLNSTASAVINQDDQFYCYWKDLLEHSHISHISAFGFNQQADVKYENGFFVTPKNKIKINLALPGEHNIKNALCAISAVLLAKPDIDLNLIKQALEKIKPVSGRLEFLKSKNNAVIINDSYNSSPASIEAGLKVLSAQPGKKILVLSDMAEVGEYEIKAHQDLAKMISENNIDCFIAIGKLIKYAYEKYDHNNKVYFENKTQAEHYIKNLNQPDSVFLVKGSRGMKMEKVVEFLL